MRTKISAEEIIPLPICVNGVNEKPSSRKNPQNERSLIG